MIMAKQQPAKKSGIPKLASTKLRKAVVKPLDPSKTVDNYNIILAEIDNEYNDLLLS